MIKTCYMVKAESFTSTPFGFGYKRWTVRVDKIDHFEIAFVGHIVI